MCPLISVFWNIFRANILLLTSVKPRSQPIPFNIPPFFPTRNKTAPYLRIHLLSSPSQSDKGNMQEIPLLLPHKCFFSPPPLDTHTIPNARSEKKWVNFSLTHTHIPVRYACVFFQPETKTTKSDLRLTLMSRLPQSRISTCLQKIVSFL